MKKNMSRLVRTICGLGLGLLPLSGQAQGWPSEYKGVMLQSFYWDSFADSKWSALESQADELSQYFNLIWVPQSASCGSKSMGYDDLYWFSNYDSSFGTESQLRSMIKTFHDKGIGTIADVVINHRKTLKSWFDFPVETYKGKTYQMTSTDVCSNDDGGKAATQAKAEGVSLGSHADSGEGWDGMRDLDHYSENVQTTVKAYLDMLLNDFGYAGFRYDMTKGYSGSFTGMYNTAANPTYSVGEYFDGNKSNVTSWLDATKVDGKIQSAAFDFPIRYSARDAANNSDWTKLAGGGIATNDAYKRYAVTFVENHDTEKRSATNQQDPIRKDTLAVNAYLMAMPGTPCVFFKHWIDCKADIKNMILLRNRVGINNESQWNQIESSKQRYVFSTTGTDGKLLAAVGTTAGEYKADAGWALAAEGYHWCYYLPVETETAWPSLPSGEYVNAQSVTLRAISANPSALLVYTLDGSTPTAQSTQVGNGTTVSLPYGTTTLTVGLLADGKVTGLQTRTYKVSQFSPYSFNVYVNTDKVGWTSTYFWTWGGDGSHAPANSAWPGDEVTTTTSLKGKSWFAKSFTMNTPSDCVSFVFAQSSSVQTADVDNVKSESYFEIQSQTDASGHYVVKDVTSEMLTSLLPIVANDSRSVPTMVVGIDGRVVRRYGVAVSTEDAVRGLASGLYIVNGKKIAVR